MGRVANKAMPLTAAGGRIAVLVVSVLISFGVARAVVSPVPAGGASFNWPGQPYQRDYYGNYAYEDFSFEWWGCSGNWCWFGNAAIYANITAFGSGYEFDSYGLLFGDEGSAWPNAWEGGATDMQYNNTPATIYPSLLADRYKSVDAQSALCETAYCASMGSYGRTASLLAAEVPNGSSTGSCWQKAYPVYYLC